MRSSVVRIPVGIIITALLLTGSQAVKSGAVMPDGAAGSVTCLAGPAGAALSYREDEVLVKLKDQTDERAARAFTYRHNMRDAVKVKSEHVVGNLYRVKLQYGASVEEAVAEFKADPDVELAQPNYIYHIMRSPDDPDFGQLWGMRNTGQTINGEAGKDGADIGAEAAWNTTTGSAGIVVGVVDTGIDYYHQDLAPNLWTNPGEIPGNGIDDDHDGYLDDVHGINAVTGSGDPYDDNGHGSHVSGTIGAKGGNGVGVSGVNWTTSLMALKFMDGTGTGDTSDAVECINYAVAMKKRGVNVRALNNSWGGGCYDPLLESAISAAGASDILFVAAAGNASSDNGSRPVYPASCKAANVISVAATTNRDRLAWFSNFGTGSVHVAAPGVDVLSAFRVANGSYTVMSGTSMAAAHVTGVAALLLSAKPSLTTRQVKDIIMFTADKLCLPVASGGRVDAAKAIDTVVGQCVLLTACQDGANVVLKALVVDRGVMPVNEQVTFFQDGAEVGSVCTTPCPQGGVLPATLTMRGSLGQHTAGVISSRQAGISQMTSEDAPYVVRPPAITSLSAASGRVRALVTIKGEEFGSVTGRALMNGRGKAISVKVVSWSDSAITFTVPGRPQGVYYLSVDNGLAKSSPVRFVISGM